MKKTVRNSIVLVSLLLLVSFLVVIINVNCEKIGEDKKEKVLYLDDFDFLEVDMQYSFIIQKLGKPHGLVSGGGCSVYYRLNDNTIITLVFDRDSSGLIVAYNEFNDELIKIVIAKEIIYEDNINKKFKLDDFIGLKKKMKYSELLSKVGFPNKRTGGRDVWMWYYLRNGSILSIKYDGGISDIEILDAHGVFVKKYNLTE